MPELDLSAALGIRIADKNVLAIRIANKTVYPSLPAPLAAYSFETVDGNGYIASKYGGSLHDLVPVTQGTTPDFTMMLVPGHSGYALTSFDNGKPVAQAPGLVMPRTAVTIMGWFYPRTGTTAGETMLFGFFTGTGGDTMFAVWQHRSGFGPGGVLQANFRQTGLTLLTDGAYTMPIATWTHIAFTFDSSAGIARLYVDGSIIAEMTSGITFPLSSNTSYLYIGGYGYGGHDADSDDVRVYDVALTPEQISVAMHTPVE